MNIWEALEWIFAVIFGIKKVFGVPGVGSRWLGVPPGLYNYRENTVGMYIYFAHYVHIFHDHIHASITESAYILSELLVHQVKTLQKK